MSTKPPKQGPDGFEMPETFSFGLEPREAPKTESEQPARNARTDEKDCRHAWLKAPEERQTVTAEDKIVWCCRFCGELRITYAWKEP